MEHRQVLLVGAALGASLGASLGARSTGKSSTAFYQTNQAVASDEKRADAFSAGTASSRASLWHPIWRGSGMRKTPYLGPEVSILIVEGEIVSVLGTKRLGDDSRGQLVGALPRGRLTCRDPNCSDRQQLPGHSARREARSNAGLFPQVRPPRRRPGLTVQTPIYRKFSP